MTYSETMQAQDTIEMVDAGTATIAGREFTVQYVPSQPGLFLLTGKRGAVYATVRYFSNVKAGEYQHGEPMFLIGSRNGRVDPLGDGVMVRGTADGTLEEIK